MTSKNDENTLTADNKTSTFLDNSIFLTVRPLSTVGYTSVVASVIHSR